MCSAGGWMLEKNIFRAERTVSIVAFWLALVNSNMTRHRASDNGVNCPWLRSSTTQSSTSPEQRKTSINYLCVTYTYNNMHIICIYINAQHTTSIIVLVLFAKTSYITATSLRIIKIFSAVKIILPILVIT